MKPKLAQASAARSATGPRTDAGKKRSRRNALKYGILSRHLFLEGGSSIAFEKFLLGLVEYFQPQGQLQ
jgi:hypothetical protein